MTGETARRKEKRCLEEKKWERRWQENGSGGKVCPALSSPGSFARYPWRIRTITWPWNKCFDAAKRKCRPKEICLKTNSEVYWEQVEADERNFHFSEWYLNLGRRMVGEERAGLDRDSLVWMSWRLLVLLGATGDFLSNVPFSMTICPDFKWKIFFVASSSILSFSKERQKDL